MVKARKPKVAKKKGKSKPKVKAKPVFKSPAKPKPKARKPRAPRKPRADALTYGRAVTPNGTPEEVFDARVVQLEAAIPGFTNAASIDIIPWGDTGEVDSEGHKIMTNVFTDMVNNGWTWLILPDSEAARQALSAELGMTWAVLRVKIASCGYKFSGSPNNSWKTDHNGFAIVPEHHRCQGEGRRARNHVANH